MLKHIGSLLLLLWFGCTTVQAADDFHRVWINGELLQLMKYPGRERGCQHVSSLLLYVPLQDQTQLLCDVLAAYSPGQRKWKYLHTGSVVTGKLTGIDFLASEEVVFRFESGRVVLAKINRGSLPDFYVGRETVIVLDPKSREVLVVAALLDK